MKTKLLGLLALFPALMLNGQNGEGFELVFGDSLNQTATKVICCSDGGYLMAGHKEAGELSFSLPIIDEDGQIVDAEVIEMRTNGWLIKINPDGELEWGTEIENEGYNTEVRALTECQEGGYAAACHTTELGTSQGNISLLRLNADGQELWKENHISYSNDEPKGIVQSPDSAFIIAGFSNSDIDFSDVLVLKMRHVDKSLYENTEDPEAIYAMPDAVEWSKQYGRDHSYDEAYAIAPSRMGEILLGGLTQNPDEELLPIPLLMQLNENGELINERAYGETRPGEIKNILIDKSGAIILTGSRYEHEQTNNSIWHIKLNAEGKELWAHDAGSGSLNTPIATYMLEDGSSLTGYKQNTGEGEDWQFCTLRLSKDGKLMGEHVYEIPENNRVELQHFTLGKNGDYILVGSKKDGAKQSSGFWVRQISPDKD